MKSNVKFLLSVTSILLLSSFVLVGCMRAISADNGGKKSYNLDMLSREDLTGGIVEDNPITQGALKSKFQAMYEISDDKRSITVISEEYLQNYWESNYEEEKIHSLSSEEINYIVQDSVRIYEEYDEVVLVGFASASSTIQVAERFPLLEAEVVKTKLSKSLYYEKDEINAIYEIILYRIKALSSPKSFFTGEEAINFVEGIPGLDSSWLPRTTFYIPEYSENTDRDYILCVVGGREASPDKERFSDLFSMCVYGDEGAKIEFSSKNNGATKLYPTAEMKKPWCRVESIIDSSVLEGIDTSDAIELIYENELFAYYFPSIRSQYVYAKLDDGRMIPIKEALEDGYITPKSLFSDFDLEYFRTVKHNINDRNDEDFSWIYYKQAVYTDKLTAKGSFPYVAVINSVKQMKEYTDNIKNNNLYVTDRGSFELPSYDEWVTKYTEEWFKYNSLFIVVAEGDSNVVPQIGGYLFDQDRIDIYLPQKQLGYKKDQVYTIFVEMAKKNVENVNVIVGSLH